MARDKPKRASRRVSKLHLKRTKKLFDDHNRKLVSYISRILGRPNDVEAIGSETWLRILLQKAPNTVRNPEAFIYTVARHLAIDETKYLSRWDQNAPPPDVAGVKIPQ